MRRFWQYQPIILAVWPYLILISLSLPDADAFSRFLTLYTLLTVPVYLCSFRRAAPPSRGYRCPDKNSPVGQAGTYPLLSGDLPAGRRADPGDGSPDFHHRISAAGDAHGVL